MISYKKLFHGFIWLLFFSFLVLYFAQKGGYYKDLNTKKKELTEEKIKQFEIDVANGKEIKVENYVVDDIKNYNNRVSDFGRGTSKLISTTFEWTLKTVFKSVDKMMNN